MEILERIEKYKDSKAIAMVHNGDHITYQYLWESSNRLAGYLQQTLKDDKNPLIVFGHKEPFMLICFLACVKSGRAYCPIDITVPPSRVQSIIETVDGKYILAVEDIASESKRVLSRIEMETIINNDSYVIDRKEFVKPNDVYYIIFTSGSTGVPKGVQITSRNLSRFVDWAVSLKKDHHRVFINQAPFSFDLSVMDLYMALGSGSTLWTLDKEIQKKYSDMFTSLQNSNANVWVSTPSFVDLCLIDKTFDQNLLPNLELFLFCGETLTNKTVELLHQKFPQAIIYNTYGPTESTVAITEVEVTKEVCNAYNPLPVGKAKPGTWIKIMQEGLEMNPEQTGEIIIVGDTVSCGYYKNVENTKKSFFTMDIDGVTYPAYRTGDRGYLKDNQLFYKGRIDLQIKLHGYRMEIEDIEKNILKVENIKSIVVLPNYEDDKVKSLTAYCVYDGDTSSRLKTTQIIKQQLREVIPEYMIPKKFIFIDHMPTTNNGKVDRKKLMEAVS